MAKSDKICHASYLTQRGATVLWAAPMSNLGSLPVTADQEILPRRRLARWGIVVSLFAAALGVRMLFLDQIDFAPLRQLRSAIIARGYYYHNNPAISPWENTVSQAQRERENFLEPPVMEHLAAAAYRAVGHEHFWIPRLFSCLWWLLGGCFVWRLASRISLPNVPLIATAVYLLVPFGAVASRSFQPDPLGVMACLGSVLLLVRYDERPTFWRLIGAAIVSGFTMFIKAPFLFYILGAFIGIVLRRRGIKGMLIAWHTYAFFLLTGLVGVLYYAYGLHQGWAIHGQILSSFLPHLWLKPTFWAGWLAQLQIVVGFPFLFCGLVGTFFLRYGKIKSLLLGLWGGYLFSSLITTYHTSTHDYYHLPVIPLVAFGTASLLSMVMTHARQWGFTPSRQFLLVGIALALGVASDGLKIFQVNFDRHGRWQKNERQIAPEIGELVHHTTKAAYLSISEGYPLRYFGKLTGGQLIVRNEALEKYLEKKPELVVEEFLSAENLGFEPEYFIVTELLEFKRKPQLMEYLDSHFPLIAQKPDYLIYDLQPTAHVTQQDQTYAE